VAAEGSVRSWRTRSSGLSSDDAARARAGSPAAGGEGFVTDAAGLAAEDGGAGSGVAGDGEGTAVARCCGEDAGAAVDGAAVLAGSLCAAPATVLRAPTVLGPDISSAAATAATMSSRAAAEAVTAVRIPEAGLL